MGEKYCPHCGTKYSADQKTCPADGAVLFELRAGADRSGTVLAGKFKLERMLGEGGFGSVYLAMNMVLGRPVAIKLVKPELAADAQVVERFLNEARLVTRLSHPHTITTYDLYQDVENKATLILSMEYVEGQTLRDVQKGVGGRLEWPRAVRIATMICESLEEAHEVGIIHRDLKPANIMLTRLYGKDDYVKVMDFGIAKAVEGRDEPSPDRHGDVRGIAGLHEPRAHRREGSGRAE